MEKERLLRILILEDSEEDVVLLLRSLQKSKLTFTYEIVDTREEYEFGLLNFKPEVILSDHALPMFNAMDALKLCRTYEDYIPFILVTGHVSEEFAASCIGQGADDYILKSNLRSLPGSIQRALVKRKAEQERRAALEDLQVQNQMLTQVNHELDSFVCSTSHNLRTPLRSVLGLLHLFKLEMNKGNKESSESYFRMMETSIAQLDDSLKSILDFSNNSRINEARIEEIDFEDLLSDMFDKVRFMNVETVVQKLILVHPGSTFSSNKMRLEIVLANLLSNAVKYSDPSKPKSLIKMIVFTNQLKSRIIIQDNGIGIADEHQESVFKMFYRATEKSEGTGLGLYIVKEAIKRLGGSIALTSSLGKGTTITLSIPNMYRLDEPSEEE